MAEVSHLYPQRIHCFPTLSIHEGGDSIFCILLTQGINYLISIQRVPQAHAQYHTGRSIAMLLVPGPFLFTRCCHCLLWVRRTPRGHHLPHPTSREGKLYYFPSSGPNSRHYLLTYLKRFALICGGGGDDGNWVILQGRKEKPVIAKSRREVLEEYCGPFSSFCVF